MKVYDFLSKAMIRDHLYLILGFIWLTNPYIILAKCQVSFLWMKIHALESDELLRSISASCWGGSVLSAKNCREAWRSGSRLVRGQVSMEHEVKLYSSVHLTLEALVMWPCVIGQYHGGGLDLYCQPMLAAGIADFSASHWFAEPISQMLWCH